MTTYILGAGASLHAGYPLARNLWSELCAWYSHRQFEHHWYNPLATVREVYGERADLEQVLTELDEYPPLSRAAALREPERAACRQALLLSTIEFFNDRKYGPSPLYDQFARTNLRSGDVVITFNYDLACEHALKEAGIWEISDGYGFRLGIDAIPPSSVKVLKLHGSTNWWGPVFGGMTGSFQAGSKSLPDRPVILQREFGFFSYSNEISDPLCGTQTSPAVPALISLSRRKFFYIRTSIGGREWEPFWNALWGQAGDVLNSSDKIVIIGYSMPDADERARDLLFRRCNRDAQIAIFSGGRGTQIAHEFTSRGFRRIETLGRGRFEDFLAAE
jgi:hypothetical protein